MEALRKIRTVETERICIDVPVSFLHKQVEVIIIPYPDKVRTETDIFSALSESKFNQIWDNEEDSVYDKFLSQV